MDDPEYLAARMAAELDEIERTAMPFGKFGPDHFPPRGVPIYDLPVEYLAWFARKASWPRGRLGHLLKVIHQMKVDGLDLAFDAMRRRAGGKTNLRPPAGKKSFHFE
jgi:uncharacterized protein (DUF3820 family)